MTWLRAIIWLSVKYHTWVAIGVYSVKGDWELTNNMQSKIMAMVFSIAAEIKHNLISQCTGEALQAKKARGRDWAGHRDPGKVNSTHSGWK